MLILLLFGGYHYIPSIYKECINTSQNDAEMGLNPPAWPMLRGDPHHTGFARRILSEGEPELMWIFKRSNESFIGPVVGYDETIYEISFQGKVYALTPEGVLKWMYEVGDRIFTVPAVDKKGDIYFGSFHGKIYSLDPNGTLLWEYNTGDLIESSPIIGSDNILYFSSGKNLYAFYLNGTLKWKVETGTDRVLSPPTQGYDSSIYLGILGGLMKFSPEGKLRWRITMGNLPPSGVIGSAPAIDSQGNIYVGSGDGRLFAIKDNGKIEWTKEDIKMTFYDSPAIYKDFLYVAGHNGIYTLNKEGKELWNRTWKDNRSGVICTTAPVITADRTIYATSPTGIIYALTPEGSPKWEYKLNGNISRYSSIAIGGRGCLYISTENGILYAFKIGKGIEVEPSQPGLRIVLKNNTAMLNILPPFDDGGSNITFYRIYRSEDGKGFVKIAETKNTTYVDTMEKGRKYEYYVTAVNSVGESEKSNVVEIYMPSHASSKNSVYWIYFGIGALCLIVAVVVWIYYRTRGRERK